MLMTIEELKAITGEIADDSDLSRRLEAVEFLIRGYTHNTFRSRYIRAECRIMGGIIWDIPPQIAEGDTIQISGSRFNNGIYTVTNITDGRAAVDGSLYDSMKDIVSLVIYPNDVKTGAAMLVKYGVESEEHMGIRSETISRHSVTYSSSSDEEHIMGYPKDMMQFLRPYIKARF